MSECELISTCPFFNGKLQGNAARIEDLKQKYCRSNNLNCARYMVANALGRDYMPPDLFPDQKERAYTLIVESG